MQNLVQIKHGVIAFWLSQDDALPRTGFPVNAYLELSFFSLMCNFSFYSLLFFAA